MATCVRSAVLALLLLLLCHTAAQGQVIPDGGTVEAAQGQVMPTLGVGIIDSAPGLTASDEGAAEASAISALCSDAIGCRQTCRQACNLATIKQQWNLIVNGSGDATSAAALAAIAAQMYTPDASLVVTPIGAFNSALLALEYVLTFSRKPADSVPPPTTTLLGFQIRDAVATDTTVTFVFELLLSNTFIPTRTAPLRGWTMYAFNEVSKITSHIILYPLWDETSRALGILERDVKVVTTAANQVCTAHQASCTGPYKQYTSRVACLAFMLALPPPPVHRLAGNNLLCRHFHARWVDVSPDVHCAHIGPTGGGKCTEDLPYTLDKIDQLMPNKPTFYSIDPLLHAEFNKSANL